MNDLKKRTMHSAIASLDQAISMITDETTEDPLYDLDIQTLRNAATQAAQAATDLTLMVGIAIAEDTIRQENKTK